jgi:hypothetical protein
MKLKTWSWNLFGRGRSIQNAVVQGSQVETVYSDTDYTFPILSLGYMSSECKDVNKEADLYPTPDVIQQ